MKTTTSSRIIEALKAVFSRHGIPEKLVSDNWPRYSSQEFVSFAKQYDFCHLTSSPTFHRAMGRQRGQYRQ